MIAISADNDAVAARTWLGFFAMCVGLQAATNETKNLWELHLSRDVGSTTPLRGLALATRKRELLEVHSGGAVRVNAKQNP